MVRFAHPLLPYDNIKLAFVTTEFVALNLKLRSSSVEGSSSLRQTKSSEESTASDMNQWLQSLLGPEEESEDHLSATVDLGSSPSLVVDDKSAASTAVLTCQLVPRRGLSKATQTQEHSNISPAVECSFPSTHSSGKTLGCVTTDGSVTASSFHTQTGDACLQSSIGWDCRYDAVKRVRFNEEKIGLIIVKVVSQIGYILPCHELEMILVDAGKTNAAGGGGDQG